MTGLLPDIKSKVTGVEGNLEKLLTKARFEEAKLRELKGVQKTPSLRQTHNLTLHNCADYRSGIRRQPCEGPDRHRGSPVTIVSLKFLVDALKKCGPPRQSPTDWRACVEKQMKPTTLSLQNYGGGEVNLVREIKVTIKRAAFTDAIIQFKSGHLLICC